MTNLCERPHDSFVPLTIPYGQRKIHVSNCVDLHRFQSICDVHDDRGTKHRCRSVMQSYCISSKIFVNRDEPCMIDETIIDERLIVCLKRMDNYFLFCVLMNLPAVIPTKLANNVGA